MYLLLVTKGNLIVSTYSKNIIPPWIPLERGRAGTVGERLIHHHQDHTEPGQVRGGAGK